MTQSLFQNSAGVPLAEKLRPADLNDFIGQEHILGEGKILRRLIEYDRIIPMIFWGPPGCGKTTLAKIIANKTSSEFVSFSAVTGGVGDARKIIEEARSNQGIGKKTIFFVDEIHRFNKSQQDLFLPYVENGIITLIGATTENPSFQVNAPLLSRARVFHFREHTEDGICKALKHAIQKINSNFSFYFPKLSSFVISSGNSQSRDLQNNPKISISIKADATKAIASLCEGDIRDAYNSLELAIISAQPQNNKIIIDKKLAEESIQQKFIRYDKAADGHFDAISALHKSIRASQPDAALHYLARMLEAGEEPLYVMRRLTRCASEDIGMADPFAIVLATSVLESVRQMGMPECNDAIAELVIYLCHAPKSRAVDEAYAKAKDDVINKRLDPIPLKIRNAPTKLMKDFGFGKGYKMYDSEALLPDNLKNQKYWTDSV
ncbi:MAG: replication-associated recombination protein A [Candidatus Berkelbacteria bacterium]|nr:replication-associated recombination protein A [Candidatus Berkelbacteria bacterium]